jgi:leader peptidase (prepilin peptidase)/N-methyltransferase
MLQTDFVTLTGLLVVAAVVGSFLGTLILRLPVGLAVVTGRSECPNCNGPLGPRDLVPLLSWASARGRCRTCAAPISVFYPFIELAAIGVALWSWSVVEGWVLWASCFFGWLLLTLAVLDWRHQLLPDKLTLLLVPSGVGVAYFIEPADAIDHIIGAIAGFIAFAAVAWTYRRIRGRDGLGGGDLKLLAGLGAWVGWIGLPTIILLSTFMALATVAARMILGERFAATDRLAFGTYLAAAGWLVWLYGPLVPM